MPDPYDEYFNPAGSAAATAPPGQDTREPPAADPYSGYFSGPQAPSPPPRAPAEMKAWNPSPTEKVKYFLQDLLMGAGAQPHVARHLAEGGTGIASMTPMGSVLAAADLPYDVSRGSYGNAALDVVGAVPGARAVQRTFQGMPRMRPAEMPPPWVERGTPEARGWVTPSTEELIGRGRPPTPAQPAVGLLPAEPAMPGLPQGSAIAGYDRTRNSPLTYHPDVGGDFARRATAHIESPQGGSFSPEGVPGVYGILDRFEQGWGQRGRPVTASDWDTMRQQLRNLEGKEGAAGQRVVNQLDAYMQNPPPGAFTSGTPADLARLRADFAQARGDYRAGKTAQTVENAIDRAGTRAGATYSGMNVDNATRQRLESLQAADAPYDKLFGATPGERAAVTIASQGDPVTNQLRAAGKFMGGGGGLGRLAATSAGSGLAGSAAHLLGVDPATTAAITFAGGAVPFTAGRAMLGAANERTVRAAEEVANRIRRNSPEYRRRVAATPDVADPNAMIRDAITYTMLPQVRQQGQDAWQNLYVPYENR